MSKKNDSYHQEEIVKNPDGTWSIASDIAAAAKRRSHFEGRTPRIAEVIAGAPYRSLCMNMPRTADTTKWYPVPQDVKASVANDLVSHQAPILYVDDVYEEIRWDIANQTDVMDIICKAPSARPAFDRMFIECSSLTAMTELVAIGGMVQLNGAQTAADAFCDRLLGEAKRGIITQRIEGSDTPVSWTEDEVNAFRTTDHVAIHPYVYREDGKVFGPTGVSFYFLDPVTHTVAQLRSVSDQKNVPLACSFPWQTWSFMADDVEEAQALASQTQDVVLALCVQSIALLNCSNVQYVEAGVTNSDVGKKERRHKRLAQCRFHVLKVKVGTELRAIREHHETGDGHRPLHMVRGHFRDYSKGPGLFGKYKKPAVWVPAHLRGHADHGIVTRDYQLEPGTGSLLKETGNDEHRINDGHEPTDRTRRAG